MTQRWRRLFVATAIVVRTAAAEAQTSSFVQIGSIPGPADLVAVQGSRAYVAAGKTLTVVDVSDPAAPKRAGSYTFPELIWNLAIAGSTVYVAADTYGMGIVEASNPAVPVLRGAMKTRGQAKAVAVFGTKALVADHVAGVDVIDVSNDARPVAGGSFFVDGFAKDVVVRGTLAYVLDQPSGFYVFDLTRTGSFEPTATIALASPIALRSQLAVSEESAKAGVRVAVVAGGGPLQVVDVSNPQRPRQATTYRTPGVPQRVAVIGTRAYIADGPSGLQVVDLSSPATPAGVGAFKTATPARDVAVAGSLVFVVLASGDVLILRETR